MLDRLASERLESHVHHRRVLLQVSDQAAHSPSSFGSVNKPLARLEDFLIIVARHFLPCASASFASHAGDNPVGVASRYTASIRPAVSWGKVTVSDLAAPEASEPGRTDRRQRHRCQILGTSPLHPQPPAAAPRRPAQGGGGPDVDAAARPAGTRDPRRQSLIITSKSRSRLCSITCVATTMARCRPLAAFAKPAQHILFDLIAPGEGRPGVKRIKWPPSTGFARVPPDKPPGCAPPYADHRRATVLAQYASRNWATMAAGSRANPFQCITRLSGAATAPADLALRGPGDRPDRAHPARLRRRPRTPGPTHVASAPAAWPKQHDRGTHARGQASSRWNRVDI